MIQNRMTIVTSPHPDSSKWCCSGAILKTRFPVILKNPIWITTDRDDEHEQAADDHGEQLGARQDRQAGQRAAQGERAGVAHEDLGGVGVPPQEADAGARDAAATIARSCGSRTS